MELPLTAYQVTKRQVLIQFTLLKMTLKLQKSCVHGHIGVLILVIIFDMMAH